MNKPIQYILGATSMLGWNLLRLDREQRFIPVCNPYIDHPACRDWRRLRLEDRGEVAALFRDQVPELVVHCAGICDVEKCEENPDWAYTINVQGTRHVLEAVPGSARLVYVSSDHVFAGRDEGYDESDDPDAISVYGRTRVEAEQRILKERPDALIIRASLAIGPSLDGKSGHLDWLRHRTSMGLPTTIVEGEERSAVWVEDLVERVVQLADSNVSGIRHVPAARTISRVELARYLVERFNIPAVLGTEPRENRKVPHLGSVELLTSHDDEWAVPLPGPDPRSMCSIR